MSAQEKACCGSQAKLPEVAVRKRQPRVAATPSRRITMTMRTKITPITNTPITITPITITRMITTTATTITPTTT